MGRVEHGKLADGGPSLWVKVASRKERDRYSALSGSRMNCRKAWASSKKSFGRWPRSVTNTRRCVQYAEISRTTWHILLSWARSSWAWGTEQAKTKRVGSTMEATALGWPLTHKDCNHKQVFGRSLTFKLCVERTFLPRADTTERDWVEHGHR